MATNDFFDKINKSYMIPSSIMISDANEPIDVRNTCEKVSDFDELAKMGMDFRYDGLITYEISTQSWKGCRKTETGFEWIDMLSASQIDLSGFAKKEHTHEEYLPTVSDDEPIAMPKGHVWIDPVD